jgi:hypothetical protein
MLRVLGALGVSAKVTFGRAGVMDKEPRLSGAARSEWPVHDICVGRGTC